MPGLMSIGGIASGLKVDDIITKYMEIARKPQKRLQDQKAADQQKLATWQDLNTRVLALQMKCAAIGTSSGFLAKQATSSSTDIATVTASSAATAGTYYVTVSKTAKSHQVSTAPGTYTSLDATIGSGDLNIIIGGITTKVVIDSDNNTLVGVKDAINRSGAGVRASILNLGTASSPDYSLQITSANTGEANTITFDGTTAGISFGTTVQSPQDAEINIGTLTLKRSSNSITDIIPGVTLNIVNPDVTKTVKIDVTQDTSAIKTAIQGFVSQYNDLMKTINDQFKYDSTTGNTGILMGNYQLQSIQMDIESMVTGVVTGIPYDPKQKNYNSLSSVGITIGSNGQLSINDTELTAALSEKADAVAKIFTTNLDSDSQFVSLAASTSDTKPSGAKGYDVDITQAATRPEIRAGKAWADAGVTTLDGPETLTINDTQISLAQGLTLTQVIAAINQSSSTTNVSAYDTIVGADHYLTLRSNQYGSNRDFTAFSNLSVFPGTVTSGLGNVKVSITSYSGENGLGMGTPGKDVVGTINGQRCKGSGQILTADPEDANSSLKGLSLIATNSSPLTTNVRFIKGVGTNLKDMLTKMTSSGGVFSSSQTSLTNEMSALDKDIEDMEGRIQGQQDRMYEQFNRMETQLAQLQDQGNYLTAQLGALNNNK